MLSLNENNDEGVPLPPIDMTAIDVEWAKHAELQDLDLSHCLKTHGPEMVARLREVIMRHRILWQTHRKYPPVGASKCSFTVKDTSAFFRRTAPMNPQMHEELNKLVDAQLQQGIIVR